MKKVLIDGIDFIIRLTTLVQFADNLQKKAVGTVLLMALAAVLIRKKKGSVKKETEEAEKTEEIEVPK